MNKSFKKKMKKKSFNKNWKKVGGKFEKLQKKLKKFEKKLTGHVSITLIKCLKGHKSLGSLCSVVKTLIVSLVRPTKQGTDKVTYWAIVDS